MIPVIFLADDKQNNLHYCIYILALPGDPDPCPFCCVRDNLYKKINYSYWKLYDILNIDSIFHYGCLNILGSIDYHDQMSLAAKLLLNDNPHKLLENLLQYDLDLLSYYNQLYDKHNNPSVFLYIQIDDKIDKLLLYVHLSMETELHCDQTLLAAML